MASESLEERVARIEGVLSRVDKRLNHLESELVEFRKEFRSEIGRLSEKIDRNFRWTIGIMLSVLIPMWVTIILAILLRA